MSESDKLSGDVHDAAVIELIMGYLKKAGFSKSLYFLEKESGISIFRSTKEISFLRELVLSGSWDDTLQFLEPLRSGVTEFNRVECAVLKCQFYDLVDSIRNSSSCSNAKISITDPLSVKLSDTIRRLESLCGSPSEFSLVCSYLMPKSKGSKPSFMNRMECFDLICSIIQLPSQNTRVSVESLFQLPAVPSSQQQVDDEFHFSVKKNLNEILHSGIQKERQVIESSNSGHSVSNVKIHDGFVEFRVMKHLVVNLNDELNKPAIGDISQVKSGKKSLVWDLNFLPAKSKPINEVSSISQPSSSSSSQQHQQQVERPVDPSLHPMPSSYEGIRIIESDQPLRSCSFSLDGNVCAIGSNARWVRVMSCQNTRTAASYTYLHQFNNVHKGSVYSIDIGVSNEMMMMVTGSNDKTIRLIAMDDEYTEKESDVGDGNVIRGHTGTIRSVAFLSSSSLSTVVSAGSGDFAIHVSDVNQLSVISTLMGHTNSVHGLCCPSSSTTSSSIFSGGEDSTIRMWDIRTRTCSMLLSSSSSGSVSNLARNLIDDFILASSHTSGHVCLWDIRTGNRLTDPLLAHYGECRSISLASGWSCRKQREAISRLFVTSSFDQTCAVVSYDKSAQLPLSVVGRYKGHSDKVLNAVWNPNLPVFVSTGVDGLAISWSPT